MVWLGPHWEDGQPGSDGAGFYPGQKGTVSAEVRGMEEEEG